MATKKATNGATNSAAQGVPFAMIAIDKLQPNPHNRRGKITKTSLEELAASIKESGILQPITVRPVDGSMQIISGERRWRAAQMAKLKEVPAYVRPLDDEEAAIACAAENLQRKGLHPLQESEEFNWLVAERRMTPEQVAAKLGVSLSYVVRRLPLASLSPEVKADFFGEHISLGHALELARIPVERQPKALERCYTNDYFNGKYGPNKSRLAPIADLKEWIRDNVMLSLTDAPFKQDDATLREDGRTCTTCQFRTGHNRSMFEDIPDEGTCMDSDCFEKKCRALVQIQVKQLEEKQGSAPPLISLMYQTEAADTLSTAQYTHVGAKKADRCAHAEQAVVSEGSINKMGQIAWICRYTECPDHAGRAGRPSQYNGNGGRSEPTPADTEKKKKARKQELFDMKVAEEVRLRVFKQSVPTYRAPLSDILMRYAVLAAWERIPSEHQATAHLVWGSEITKKVINNLDMDGLVRLLMLCAFAHHGANKYMTSQVSQAAVEALASDRGLDLQLIDAQVRAELSPKKYRTLHQEYLTAVQAGDKAKKPHVY